MGTGCLGMEARALAGRFAQVGSEFPQRRGIFSAVGYLDCA